MHYLKYHPETHTLSGELLVCDSPTLTGRTYPMNEVKVAIEVLQPKVANKDLVGELGMSVYTNFTEVNVNNAAIRVEEVYFKGKKLHGTLKILNTDSGKLLQSLINAKCKFKAAMIAIGTVTHGTVRDLNIITFNVVRV